MNPRTALAATAVIGYWIASVLGHLEVSLWLVQQRESQLLGTYKLADLLPHAGALLLAAVVIWQALRARHGSNRAITLAAWAVWLAAVALVDRFLIYSFPEYLHYPQYALLAWLTARHVDPDRGVFAIGPVLLAVTLLGIADEALQYAWITISYSNYLDFNDFLLNLLGGIAGLLLHYGFTRVPLDARSESGMTKKDESGMTGKDEPGMTTMYGRGTTTRTTVIPGSTGNPAERPSGSARHPIQSAARYGLLGFAWLGTGMLLAIAALQAAQADPHRLHPIERQPSYATWIPGPHAGRYYVLDPVTGTLILVGLGALASAAPGMRRQDTRSNSRSPEML